MHLCSCKSFAKIVPIPKHYRACLSKISEIVLFTVQTPNTMVVSPFLSASPIWTSFFKTHLCEQSSLPPPLTSLALPALSFRPIRLIRPAKKPLCSGCLLSRLNFLPVLLCPQAVWTGWRLIRLCSDLKKVSILHPFSKPRPRDFPIEYSDS